MDNLEIGCADAGNVGTQTHPATIVCRGLSVCCAPTNRRAERSMDGSFGHLQRNWVKGRRRCYGGERRAPRRVAKERSSVHLPLTRPHPPGTPRHPDGDGALSIGGCGQMRNYFNKRIKFCCGTENKMWETPMLPLAGGANCCF